MASNYFDLLREFFVTDFKLRYKHSYLGFLWVVMKPLSQYAVLYVIWTSLFDKTADFASYLLIGILSLSYFSEGVVFGMQSLQNKAHIILKVRFPREVVVLSSVMIATVNFLINLCIYFAFRLVSQEALFSQNWPLFIYGFVLLTVFLFGLAFYTSIISVKYHDIRHLIELLLQLMFWATPIFYSLDQLPASIAQILRTFNPLVTVVALFRGGLLQNADQISWTTTIVMTVFVVFFTLLGFWTFKKRLPKIAEFF